ncbi:MAG: acylhydrolase [Verrucomicrobiaceae bacterium]|nr:acylhydrolase [Verrucomicrobiaceae bacterium]
MNTKTIISLIGAVFIAISSVYASGVKQKSQAKKKPVFEWTIPSLEEKFNKDEAVFWRYAKANKNVKKAPIAVFMGDSITDGWAKKRPAFFAQNNYAGRGISGQVTSQMLVRFRKDVIDLKPEFVLILAGTNDVARNRGYISEENIVGNIISMCEISKANNIKPIICSILPAAEYKWRPVIKSVEPIKRINAMLKKYAQENEITYLDYYSKLDDGNGGLSKAHALDGVHPTNACYTIMEAMAKQTIESLRK